MKKNDEIEALEILSKIKIIPKNEMEKDFIKDLNEFLYLKGKIRCLRIIDSLDELAVKFTCKWMAHRRLKELELEDIEYGKDMEKYEN